MAEKSLDDQIKEAELAKLKSEDEKVKAETALARKQINAKWYSGKSLAQITATVLTLGAVYGVVDQWILKDVRESRSTVIEAKAELAKLDLEKVEKERESIKETIASLNNKARQDSIAIEKARSKARQDSISARRQLDKAEKEVANLELKQKNIGATLDTLDAKVVLAAAGFSVNDPAVFKNALKRYRMIKKEGYYDRRLNPDGKGIKNKYEKKVVKGDSVIYDAATNLTWQGGNEYTTMNWTDAKAYVDSLSYAGGGWRLPTLREAMSLMEPERVEGIYIDALFKDTPYIWTADEYARTDTGDALIAWVVDFFNGYCSGSLVDSIFNYHVRAVR